LRRNLPFLPGLYRVFLKYSINELGDEQNKFIWSAITLEKNYKKLPGGWKKKPVIHGLDRYAMS